MRYPAIVNQVEILLFSALTSVMSGMNTIKVKIQPQLPASVPYAMDWEADFAQLNDPPRESRLALAWKSFQQVLLTLLLWTILGFAAGFLMGMIKPW